MLGAASMRGVPALGLPKISNLVSDIFIRTFSASRLWSTRANKVTPFASRMFLRRATVSLTEWLLGRSTMPLPLALLGCAMDTPFVFPDSGFAELRTETR